MRLRTGFAIGGRRREVLLIPAGSLVVLVALMACMHVTQASAYRSEPASAFPKWGDLGGKGKKWRIAVKQYSPSAPQKYANPYLQEQAKKPRIQWEFGVIAEVLEPEVTGRKRIGRVRLSIDDPRVAKCVDWRALIARIDLDSGQLVAFEPKSFGPFAVNDFGERKLVLSDVLGIPVDWIVSKADFAEIPSKELNQTLWYKNTDRLEVRISSVESGELCRLPGEANTRRGLRIENGLYLGETWRRRIIQTWVPGEGWWRTFQRVAGDRPDLEAQVIGVD